MDRTTRHFLLRDRRRWHGTLAGLAVDRDGALTLATVPAPADGRPVAIATPLPAVREVSGIAAGPNGAVFVSDTAGHRLLFVDGACGGARAWLPPDAGLAGRAPGQFHAPRGLALGAQALQVADSGNARLQHLALPALEPHVAWAVGPQPVGVAVDRQGRVVTVDAVSNRVERRDERGAPDGAFDAAVNGAGVLVRPRWVATGRDDRVLVSDIAADEVFVFDAHGALLGPLPGPAGWRPGALAADDERIYVADAASARLLAFEADGAWIGELPHWSGPVTALALRAGGDLLVKSALDARFVEFTAGRVYVADGRLQAGPLDAGVGDDWERAWCEASTPEATHCRLEFAHQASDAPPPVAWHAAASGDVLLPAAATDPAGTRRYLWLRVTLSSTDGTRSPRLAQARAATAGEDYLDYLPLTYRLHDAAPEGGEGFLSRLLKLLRGEFAVIEEALDRMPRIADPLHTAGSDLAWLAGWLALELPQVRSDEENRALIARAVRLYDRRGTPGSIAAFVELHTGIRPTLVEDFDGRGVWVLGVSSRLGFDTQLPALDPLGWVVSDPDATPGGCPAQPPGELAREGGCERGCQGDGESVPEPCTVPPSPIGRVIVGEGGPLAPHQAGLPLFAEQAHRFCVLVDAYRICDASMLEEIHRIVEREKPAHTDYRLQLVQPDLRVGMQSRVGIDAIVGGEAPGWRFAAELGTGTRLAPRDAATRLDELVLGRGLTLN